METTFRHPGFAVLFALCIAGFSLAEHARADTTFSVNTTLDRIDDDVGDGECNTPDDTCSLRAAIMQANHLSGPGTTHIRLPAGTYTLTRPATGANGEDNGDLNLTTSIAAGQVISIEGASAATSFIDANQIDRVISIDTNRIVNISDVTIRRGYLPTGNGGGIKLSGSLTMRDSIVADNSATGSGGGIFVEINARLDVLRSTFLSNQSLGSVGGAAVIEGEATFRETNMSANRSRFGGAIFLFGAAARMNLIKSTISNNSAIVGGGGVHNNMGQAFVVNSTISGNIANRDGGGIYNEGTTWLYNTSIINNDSSHDRKPPGGVGGGVYNLPGNRFVAINSLIADNTTLDAPIADDCNGLLEVYGWNLLVNYGGCSFSGNGVAARGQVSTNTIGPLANNGGPTWTHALLAGSEAIDTTTAQGCVDSTLALLTTDQRGAPRIAGAKCDVGAYEYSSVVPESDVIYRNGFD